MNKRIDLHTKNSIVFKLNPDLKVLGDELVQRAQDSEKEFMTIGSRLQDFFAVTDRIAKMSSKITHFLSGSEISGTIDSLRELMIQMNNYIKDSEVETSQRVEELTRLLSTIKSLYTPIEEIRRNNGTLKTVEEDREYQEAQYARFCDKNPQWDKRWVKHPCRRYREALFGHCLKEDTHPGKFAVFGSTHRGDPCTRIKY